MGGASGKSKKANPRTAEPRTYVPFQTVDFDGGEKRPKKLPEQLKGFPSIKIKSHPSLEPLQIMLQLNSTPWEISDISSIPQVCKSWYQLSWIHADLCWARFLPELLRTGSNSKLSPKALCFEYYQEISKIFYPEFYKTFYKCASYALNQTARYGENRCVLMGAPGAGKSTMWVRLIQDRFVLFTPPSHFVAAPRLHNHPLHGSSQGEPNPPPFE